MFIYSMRASTIKFCGVLCVALVALITLIAFVPAYGSEAPDASAGQNVDYNYEKIKTNDDRIEFLSQFGWQVKSNAVAEEEVLIPEQFDKVFSGYNEIQRRQGLDLSKYKKKLVNIADSLTYLTGDYLDEKSMLKYLDELNFYSLKQELLKRHHLKKEENESTLMDFFENADDE